MTACSLVLGLGLIVRFYENLAASRNDLARLAAFRLSIEAPIGEVREIVGAVVNQPSPAPVFMHARACVERLRGDVDGLAGRAFAHHDQPALLLRPAFEPIDHAIVQTHVRETDRLRDDQVGGDR